MTGVVKVRIAVIVDDEGRWYAVGSSSIDDDTSRDLAMECFEPHGNESVRFVEAYVPFPDVQTIEGKVQ